MNNILMNSQRAFAFAKSSSVMLLLSENISKSRESSLDRFNLCEHVFTYNCGKSLKFREKFCEILPQHKCENHHIGTVTVSSSLNERIQCIFNICFYRLFNKCNTRTGHNHQENEP